MGHCMVPVCLFEDTDENAMSVYIQIKIIYYPETQKESYWYAWVKQISYSTMYDYASNVNFDIV